MLVYNLRSGFKSKFTLNFPVLTRTDKKTVKSDETLRKKCNRQESAKWTVKKEMKRHFNTNRRFKLQTKTGLRKEDRKISRIFVLHLKTDYRCQLFAPSFPNR